MLDDYETTEGDDTDLTDFRLGLFITGGSELAEGKKTVRSLRGRLTGDKGGYGRRKEKLKYE